MSERITRAFSIADIEVRSQGGDGRTVALLAVPYNTATDVYEPAFGEFRETMRHGTFARTIRERGPSRVKLLTQHDKTQVPVGHASLLREDARGLYSEFAVSKTERGDEALELARDGTLDGASVGMTVIAESWNASRTERDITEAKLWEVSLTPWPAYESAGVLAVRSADVEDLTIRFQIQRLELLRRRDPAASLS